MYVLMLVLTILSNGIIALFCCCFLTSKRKWLFAVICTTYLPILLVVLDYLDISDITLGNPIRSIVGILVFVISLTFIFKDAFTKKILTLLLATMIQDFTMNLAIPAFIYSGFVQWTPTNMALTPRFMIAQFIIVASIALVSFLTVKFLKKTDVWMRDEGLKLLTFFLLTQWILSNGIMLGIGMEMILDRLLLWIVATLLRGLSNIAVIYLLFEMGKKIHLQEQSYFYKAQLSMQLDLYQHFSDYSQILEHTRLSLVDQLSNICNALEMEKYEDASGMADRIPTNIERLRVASYCENSVINALLFMKHRDMMQSKLDFRYTVNLGESCFLVNSDLCRVISNLLDNAIDACRKLPSEFPPAVITLTCMPVQEALVIKAENPYSGELKQNKNGFPHSSKPQPGHGKGLQSIREIVTMYGGNLRIKADESRHMFTVIVTLFKH